LSAGSGSSDSLSAEESVDKDDDEAVKKVKELAEKMLQKTDRS
jgi:hypothetical protein